MPYNLTLVAAPNFSDLPGLVKAFQEHFPLARLPDWLHAGQAVDLAVGKDSPDQIKGEIEDLLTELPVDYALQPVQHRRKKLFVADMDSTMIEQECIDELAAEVGLKAEVAKITAAAMAGKIDFEPALRQRVKLLKGLPAQVIDKVIDKRISLTPGGPTLVQTMRTHGAYTALVSGGFTAFTQVIAARIGFDEAHANTLVIDKGMLAGFVKEPILGRKAKVDILRKISAKCGIDKEDALAVGDGANDLDMLRQAGLGVAFHAKPAVAAKADACIIHNDLTALLYFQGYKRKEWVEAE